jgi:UDP:flavonoid glycosyltransferase YjiC (YdhE family)
MRLLDEHWIVFPTFVTGGRTRLETLKLRFFPDYTVRQFDTLFTPSDPAARSQWLERHGLQPGEYAVFVPGGRAEGQKVADPAELFIDAARRFTEQTGFLAVVLTGRAGVTDDPQSAPLRLMPRIGPEEVQHLLAEARLVVSNGGTTLVHSLAHGRAIVTVPLAGDQDRRIRRAARLGIVVAAPREAGRIASEAVDLLNDAARREAMVRRGAEMGFANGVGEAVGALVRLARRSQA